MNLYLSLALTVADTPASSSDWTKQPSTAVYVLWLQSVMKRQMILVQMPLWETCFCGLLWMYLATRACYAVLEASTGKQLCSLCILVLIHFSLGFLFQLVIYQADGHTWNSAWHQSPAGAPVRLLTIDNWPSWLLVPVSGIGANSMRAMGMIAPTAKILWGWCPQVTPQEFCHAN